VFLVGWHLGLHSGGTQRLTTGRPVDGDLG